MNNWHWCKFIKKSGNLQSTNFLLFSMVRRERLELSTSALSVVSAIVKGADSVGFHSQLAGIIEGIIDRIKVYFCTSASLCKSSDFPAHYAIMLWSGAEQRG